MAASKSTREVGSPHINEPAEAIDLCMLCPYDDCISPSHGCDEMKALKASLKAGKPYDGPPPDWGKKPDPQELLDAAWEKLEKSKPVKKAKPAKSKPEPKPEPNLNDALPIVVDMQPIELEDITPPVQHIKIHHYNEAIKALEVLHNDATSLGPAIVEMIQAIKTDRSVRFDYLIDWDVVARGGFK